MAEHNNNDIYGFIALAKNTKGKAGANMVVQQALNSKEVFHFGELLDHPNIQVLEKEDKPMFDLLKIFAYGTYPDYKANQAQLPSLTPQQLTKLRQLTIASLSAESKVIPYTVLLQTLDLPNIRDLEDLIIDSIYAGLIRGKLDQHLKQLEIDFAIGRDFRPGQLELMIKTLNNWCDVSEGLLKTIEERVNSAQFQVAQYKQHKKEFQEQVEQAKNNIIIAMEADMAQNAEGDDDRRGKKGAKRGAGRKGNPGKRGNFIPGAKDWFNN